MSIAATVQLPGYTSKQPAAEARISVGNFLLVAGRYVANAAREGIPIPYDTLREIVRKAGIHPGMSEAAAVKQIDPYRRDVLSYVYDRIAAQCRSRGIVPVWIFLPQLREGSWQDDTLEQFQVAEAAGFVILDLQDVFRGQALESIRLAERDHHPNVHGHRLIAERLHAALLARRAAVFEAVPRPASSLFQSQVAKELSPR